MCHINHVLFMPLHRGNKCVQQVQWEVVMKTEEWDL